MGRNNIRRRTPTAHNGSQDRQSRGAAFFGEPSPAGAPGPGRGSTSAGGPELLPPQQPPLTIADHARNLVELAVRATAAGPVAGQQAHRALVEFATSQPRAGAAVGRDLSRQLAERLTSSWQRGWEPADLHRVAGRGLPGISPAPDSAQPVLMDAMAGELARYPRGSIEPRWLQQLSELEARQWWPQSSDYLSARVASLPNGWAQIICAALWVLALLSRLPELQVLGHLPGKADATTRAAAERAGQVDERVLAKVRALLAKAESTTYEAEAETFTAGAQAMMARHSIDAAMLDAARSKDDVRGSAPGAIRIGIDRPYESPKALLLDVVAGANRCRAVWVRGLGFSTVVGHEPDLAAVETLFTSLLLQSTAAMRREGSRQTAWGRSRTRSFRQSFLMAFATRIGERLAATTRQEEERASGRQAIGAAGPHANPGTEVLPVLAARDQAVEEATAQMFPELVTTRTARVGDAEGWHRGRAAAEEANLAGLDALPTGS